MKIETVGMIFVIIQLIAAGFQPIFTKLAVNGVNPLFAAAVSSLVGCIIPLIFLAKVKGLKMFLNIKNLKEVYIIGFFGTTITFILLFFGAQMTSGINTAILLQTEPIYSIFLSYFILKEKIARRQIFATILIILGIATVVYNGIFSLNLGDILIILTPLFWQISHLLAKKSIKRLGTFFIQGGRYLFAGLTMFLISTIVGTNQFSALYNPVNLSSILIIGFVVAGIGSLAWYEAIKRINLSKATAMISPYSILSVILAWFILSEHPSIYQVAGLALVLVGMLSLSKIKSEKRK